MLSMGLYAMQGYNVRYTSLEKLYNFLRYDQQVNLCSLCAYHVTKLKSTNNDYPYINCTLHDSYAKQSSYSRFINPINKQSYYKGNNNNIDNCKHGCFIVINKIDDNNDNDKLTLLTTNKCKIHNQKAYHVWYNRIILDNKLVRKILSKKSYLF